MGMAVLSGLAALDEPRVTTWPSGAPLRKHVKLFCHCCCQSPAANLPPSKHGTIGRSTLLVGCDFRQAFQQSSQPRDFSNLSPQVLVRNGQNKKWAYQLEREPRKPFASRTIGQKGCRRRFSIAMPETGTDSPARGSIMPASGTVPHSEIEVRQPLWEPKHKCCNSQLSRLTAEARSCIS